MTITAAPSPIAPNDLGTSKSRETPDRAETSGSFLDELKRVAGVEQAQEIGASDTGETPQDLGIPAITDQSVTSGSALPVILPPETADQASNTNEVQPDLPNSQNLAGQVNDSIAAAESGPGTPAPDKSETPEDADEKLSKPDDDKDTSSDTDQNVQGIELNSVEILQAAIPVAVPLQNAATRSDHDPEIDGTERKEPAQTSPVTLTTFKAFTPIAGTTKTDDEALPGSDSDTADPENDNTQAAETDLFSDMLAKSSDLGSAKQAVDEIRKNISLPNDSGQMTTPSGRPTTLNDLPLEIGMRVLEGAREIQIVLSPETLGEISIKLDIASDSSISAQFTAENPATLALLMQDASTLKRSLDQTGFSTNSTSLQFSLSREGQQNNHSHDRNSQGRQPQTAYGEAAFANPGKDLPVIPIQTYSLQRLDRII